MTPPNFEKFIEMTKRMQEPFQAMMELNIKTLQELSYVKPNELNLSKKPEDLMEEQIKIAVENGHKGIDYMQKSFHIMEKAMLGFVQETKKTVAERH